MKNITPLIPLFFAASLPAQAATLDFAELPGEIQDCLQGGTCGVSGASSAAFGDVSFFDFQTFPPQDGLTSRQLIRYELAPPSARSHALASTYDSTLDDISGSGLGGTVWLVANETYNLVDARHTFTLYLDRVTPGADNLWAWNDHPLKKIISISSADLLAGSGRYRMDYPDYTQQGSLSLHAVQGDTGYPYLSCIECSVSIDFNLVGLQYGDFGTVAALTANPQDGRTLLYSEWSYQHEGSFTGVMQQQFHVAAVPEPATWGMLLAGLGLVGGALRRKARAAA